MRRGTSSGFTLIELMVVVIIIAALAGMVLPHVLPAGDAAKKNIAKGAIANIEVALKLYRLNYGRYPTSAEGLAALRKPDPKYNNEPYLEKDAVDPWGNAYTYKYPSSHAGFGFDISSAGPDGEAGSADDVNSWDTK